MAVRSCPWLSQLESGLKDVELVILAIVMVVAVVAILVVRIVVVVEGG